MKTQGFCRTLSLILGLVALTLAAGTAWAQSGSQGTITITVVDASGGAVPITALNLVDQATNYSRKATTNENGEHTFVNLSIGVYKLTATHPGYSNAVISHVEVHASLTTDVRVALKVGASSESIEVKADVTPLMEATANAVGTVVDLKEIEDLPLTGRNLTALATLTPGYSGYGGTGSWNGQPLISQGSNIDGTIGNSSRMKIFGDAASVVTPRIETIAEMTVQTDQLDLDQGFGQAVSQTNYVSRRGSNMYHGRAFQNFHNGGLDANTWNAGVSGARKAKNIFNDFGGSVGGPIFKDKLFFFGSMAVQKIPGGSNVYVTNGSSGNTYSGVLTSAAQLGNFTYTGTDGNTYTKNVLSVAHGYSSTLPNTLNSQVSTQLGLINGALTSGKTLTTTDPNLDDLSWYNGNSQSTYFPSGRVDYDVSAKLRMYLSWTMNENIQPGVNAAPYPGSTFSNMVGGNKTKTYTSSYGVDWTVSPQIINQFKMGFLYNATFDNYNAAHLYESKQSVNWGIGNSGQTYLEPLTSYYPEFNLTDTVTLQKRGHTLKAGFTGYREQDHYWNAPSGFPTYSLGLATGDPAINAFTGSSGATCASSGSLPCANGDSLGEAGALYATLTGRLNGVGGSYGYNNSFGGYKPAIGTYALNEVSLAWGLFAQDSWRIFPTLTLNYGLRWDFTGASTDKSGLYHSSDPSSVYGPSSALFQPGTLGGNLNPTISAKSQPYAPYHVTPQPAFGLAWNPKGLKGGLGALLGDGKTVIRAGYSLRRFTEPYQYYWNNASDQGAFYYQSFSLQPSTNPGTGFFTPGSLKLGDTLPGYLYAPASYQASVPEATYTFEGNAPGGNTPGVTGIDPHIQQPYTQTWNLGIQRQFGTRALEIRYAGNRSIHQWVNTDTNEVNVFENGFLTEFKKAQANLTAYQAANPTCGQGTNPPCSFANNGLAGQSALPIIDAAFAGEASGGVGIPEVDYSNSTFLTNLANGEAGAMAGALSSTGTVNYFCNLVGSGFTPCVTNGGYPSGQAGAGKPINFFQANPYATGQETQYMVAAGYSNYHSLQVEVRQQQWKGLQFDANYTFSHTLGFQVNTNGTSAYGYGCGYYGYSGWCAWPGTLTLRNMRLAYGPAQYDIRQAVHASGTYDLPIGKGKMFLNGNNLADRMLGNWTVGTVLTFQTGTPQQLIGNNLTYNDYGDGGIVLHNVTASQLQKSVGVHRVPGKTRALMIDPKYLTASNGSGHANSSYITPNTTPGTINHPIYLYGPHAFYNDISLSKAFPIFRDIRFKLQAEATNAWNHPVFGSTSGSMRSNVQNSGFATAGVTNAPRVIEFRANIDF
jgi:hypothetical protein